MDPIVEDYQGNRDRYIHTAKSGLPLTGMLFVDYIQHAMYLDVLESKLSQYWKTCCQ